MGGQRVKDKPHTHTREAGHSYYGEWLPPPTSGVGQRQVPAAQTQEGHRLEVGAPPDEPIPAPHRGPPTSLLTPQLCLMAVTLARVLLGHTHNPLLYRGRQTPPQN